MSAMQKIMEQNQLTNKAIATLIHNDIANREARPNAQMLNLSALKKPALQLRNRRQNQLVASQRLTARQSAMTAGPATLLQIKSGTRKKSGYSFLQQVNDNKNSFVADRASVDPNDNQCLDMDQKRLRSVSFQSISLFLFASLKLLLFISFCSAIRC
jgi:hypothetical protein